MGLNERRLAGNRKMFRIFMFMKIIWPQGVVCPEAKYVYMVKYCRYLLCNCSANLKPIFICSLLAKGEYIGLNDSGHITKMGARSINSKIQKALELESWHEASMNSDLHRLYKS